MKCLCCGKEITDSFESSNSYWHKSCIKRFFGTEEIPTIDISEEAIAGILEKQLTSKEAITGIQKKLSLHLFNAPTPRLTIVDHPTGYILKPQVDTYQFLPELEYVSMMLAKACGVNCVPFGLIKTSNGSYAYITKRIDRTIDSNTYKKIPMEDFCQLDFRLTEDKYNGSYERCGSIIKKYSNNKLLDISELFLRVVFSFTIGNNDMHLKNLSLISYENGIYSLSPAYDLLSVKLVLPSDLDDLALTLHGKKRKQTKNDFLEFASTIGLSDSAAKKIINSLIRKKEIMLEIINSSILSDELKKAYSSLISHNIARLS